MAEDIYNVVIEKQAMSQLRDIVTYLIDNVSEQTADYVEAGIFDVIEDFSFMPERHMVCFEDTKKNLVYRRALKWKYVVVFTIKEISMTVRVVDIYHSAQDPKRVKDRLSGL